MSRKAVGLALGVAGSVAFLAFSADLVRDHNTAIELRSQFEARESGKSDGARGSQNQAQHSEADALHEQESEFTQKLIEPEDPRLPADQDHLADVYNNLAMTYHAQGRFAEAAEFLGRELEIYRSALGLDSPTVAFIGDQGMNSNSRAVLQLIKAEGADLVLHQGDLDYENNPTGWDAFITDVLGADFPYLASVGDHDKLWHSPDGYQDKLQARLDRIDELTCSGDLGVESVCTFRGLFFILSGAGARIAEDDPNHVAYIRNQLAQTNSKWRICSWHETQKLMQVGGKRDQVGWEPYKACREGGAIVATANEHSYSRTHLMNNFKTQSIASTANTLVIEEGKSFVFVSGLGGQTIRRQILRDEPWWASVHTSDQDANFGALFCTFFVNSKPNRARCYFKDIDGNVPDQFELISKVKNP